MRGKFDHVLQFKVTLKGIKPPIWRRIQVPCTYSFWDLHVAIQDSMGWLDYHLHQFDIRDPLTKTRMLVGMPHGEEFGDVSEVLPGWRVPITALFTLMNRKAAYEYDFGDGWEHSVALEKVFPSEREKDYPACTGGRRACPPEDCGGVYGYYSLLEIISNPDHDEYEGTVQWLGGSYGPDKFDKRSVQFDDPTDRWMHAFR